MIVAFGRRHVPLPAQSQFYRQIRRDLVAVLGKQSQGMSEYAGRTSACGDGESSAIVKTGRERGDVTSGEIRHCGKSKSSVVLGESIAIESPELSSKLPGMVSMGVVQNIGEDGSVVSTPLRKDANPAKGHTQRIDSHLW